MTQDLDLPTPEITPVPKRFWANVSVVWVVPILALIVSLGLAWSTYSSRGELITITFTDAAGLEPGQSLLKYREVTVGKVETVGFSRDLKSVEVGIRVEKDVAPFVDSEAKFWIVRPQIGFNGISGLSTVLSGVYIEGNWDDKPVGGPPVRYAGLDKPPLATSAAAGTWVTLSSDDGGALIDGAPVLFRGIKVGELRNLRLDDAGNGVLIDAFVQAPYNKQLTSSTVFWDTSGFSVSLDTSGVKLNVRSLSSLVQGGVEFNTILSGGDSLMAGQVFELFASADSARNSVFADTSSARLHVSVLLDGTVRGLKLGGDVNFRGLKVGEITNMTVQASTAEDGTRRVDQRIDLALNAETMGLPRGATEAEALEFLDHEFTDNGLRARVATSGLLGSTYFIDLAAMSDLPAVAIDRTAEPFPTLPTAAAEESDAVASAQGLMTRIGNLPIEELMTSATSFLNQLTLLTGQEDTQQLPKKLSGLIDDARGVIGSPETQAVPKSIIAAVDQAAGFFEDMKTAKTVESIGEAMTSATQAAETVTSSAEGVPELITTMTDLGKKAQGLPLEDLTRNAADLLASVNTLVGSDGMADLPKAMTESLTSLSAVLDELQQGGATANLNATLDSAQKTASRIADATETIPDLVKRLNAVIAQANTVLGAYSGDSSFNQTTLSTLRQIRDTATSFEALARTIERNPQAFILGK